jgi:hypothetical protein
LRPFDRFQSGSTWLYWAQAIADVRFGGVNTLRRVDVRSGEIQVVASSNSVLDWTSNLAALPPVGGVPVTTIVATLGQEENNPDVNAFVCGVPSYVPATLVPVVDIAE